MKAKVTELCGEILVNDDLFHNCTTTLAEIKEKYKFAKAWKEANDLYPKLIVGNDSDLNYLKRLTIYEALKFTEREFTLTEVKSLLIGFLNGKTCICPTTNDIESYLTKLPQNGLEVEIENNKIVKVYV